MKQEQEILRSCVSRTSLRYAYREPFIQNGYVNATDGYILIRIPLDKIEESYEERDNPATGRYFNIENKADIPVSFAELKEMYNDLPEIEEHEKCDACDKSGKVDYEFEYNGYIYTEEEDCPICLGEGHLGKTGRMIKDPQAGIHIGSAKFRNDHIKKIMDIMRMLECESILLVSNQISAPNVFELKGGIQILLMTMIDD